MNQLPPILNKVQSLISYALWLLLWALLNRQGLGLGGSLALVLGNFALVATISLMSLLVLGLNFRVKRSDPSHLKRRFYFQQKSGFSADCLTPGLWLLIMIAIPIQPAVIYQWPISTLWIVPLDLGLSILGLAALVSTRSKLAFVFTLALTPTMTLFKLIWIFILSAFFSLRFFSEKVISHR